MYAIFLQNDEDCKMTESVKNRIFAEIKRRGKGHVFSASDFLKKFKRFEVIDLYGFAK